MEVIAKLRHFRISSRKARLVADVIRGMDTDEAKKQLQFINKKIAKSLLKLLNSAISNAENNFDLDKDNLYIAKITVDEGPILKRWMPRAQGRADEIKKRTCHITIILDEKVQGKKRKYKKKKEMIKEVAKETKKVEEEKLPIKQNKKTGFFQKKYDKIRKGETKKSRFANLKDKLFHRKGNM